MKPNSYRTLMRDNHTFLRLPDDNKAALNVILADFDDGHHYGSLFSRGVNQHEPLHFRNDREQLEKDAIAWLEATKDKVQEPDVTVGSVWEHRNGNRYQVIQVANNCFAHFSQHYPVTVVYKGMDGKVWSRPLSDWHQSMTLVET